ncbi:MAG: efflux RND transporter periplasmic adaptor subunit [Anaeromyxobacter sp.]|nr:efflux RND transporter periplasmic adaptor subunit [Anaeromyxobacter sp.]MBL0275483.1 efflux RND transporter periplasmic adaptor subunit [Anaeromyxobacter sp.]
MKTRTKIWAGTIAGLLILAGLLVGVKAGQIRTMMAAGEGFSMPPEAVTSATVEASSWQPARPAIGTLVAVRAVTLGSELPGLIREVTFESGLTIRRGAVLVRLDTSTEEAQLQAAEADAELARLGLERARSLRQGDATSQAELDAVQARARQADAVVAQLKATIAKKTIRAPFDGRIAIRQVEVGQVVAPGTPIASLQSIDPIHAEFWLPQQALADLKVGQRVALKTDTFPDQQWDGQLDTINPEVDVATRNVRIRATVPNRDGRLRPGMFVNVEVVSGERRPVLLIPATAVLFAPYGDSVYVIEDAAKAPAAAAGQPGAAPPGPAAAGKPAQAGGLVARQRFVRLGERRGDLVAVASGVAAGEQVVSSGGFKLRNGAAVVVRNDLAPDARLAPRPSEQ